MVPLTLVPALALLFFYVSTFLSMCAVPNMAVFCSSLTSWSPGMLLTYFLNDLEIIIIIIIIVIKYIYITRVTRSETRSFKITVYCIKLYVKLSSSTTQ
jgi:ABC-type dipeptide/oligopeptide/nickel transport system permease subunit